MIHKLITMKKEINNKNKSPFGWWVATLVERFEYENENQSNLKRRCRVWTNTIILKAKDREEAFDKANKYGNLGKEDSYSFIDEKTKRKSKLVFEGISSLLPIYERIENDGTEILFEDQYVTVGRIKSWIRNKEELEVFQN